ncbi:SHOCT domain-containing protein [Lawsonibacter celer]|uniref:SHOCT domain-containing protein n=1 Tax=Lawsonibacter celer TaxID=2986526 RepID=UPI001645FB08|nr:SHOCT domain-containing protein [Lawsonibacter celer]
MRKNRRVTYRPSKSQAVFGGVVGIIFVCIGLFVAIPTFGAFGILWTLIAVGITGMNFYQAFGKGYVGPEIRIEDEAAEQENAGDPQLRLERLRTLYDQRLITQEEYETKRQEILKEL